MNVVTESRSHDRTKCKDCKYKVEKYVKQLGGFVRGCSRPLDSTPYPRCYNN